MTTVFNFTMDVRQELPDSMLAKCHGCQGRFVPAELHHPSVPTLAALSLVSDPEPWDMQRPEYLVDGNKYCTSCCRSINRRRSLIVALCLIILIASGAMVFR